jgi:hypothetical protein
MTEDEVERRFRSIVSGLDVGSVAIALPQGEGPAKGPTPPDRVVLQRHLQHRLESLRLAVGVCVLVMLLAGRWVTGDHGTGGGWATHHLVVFWSLWIVIVTPSVALVVTSLVGRVQSRRPLA